MRTNSHRSRKAEQGYGLLITLGFASLCLVLLGSVIKLAMTESTLTARNIAYNNAVIAAENATEAVIAQMTRDFRNQSLSSNSTKYASVLPSTFVKNDWTSEYQFSGAKGVENESAITCKGWETWTNLNSEFKGLYGQVNSYQITSTATKTSGMFPVSAAVRQDIELTAVPVFQFAIFYTMDLEINPGADMTVTGKTHGNANIYSLPPATLTFADAVGASGHIYHHRHPDDPNESKGNIPIYQAEHAEQVSSLTLPVGTDNSPSSVVKILDVPEENESPLSQVGSQRFYNRSDLIITTTDTSVTVIYNENEEGTSFTTVPTNTISGGTNTGYTFIRTNASFYDYREGKQVIATEIDVKALSDWLKGGGSTLDVKSQTQNNHHINSIYVYDKRTAKNKLTAVRVVNGKTLPDSGLTVVTATPLYVKGHFNAPDTTAGSTNTANTKPASLVGDALTILSANWSDSWTKDTKLDSRGSADTTVNAAILSGIVQTQKDSNDSKHYSGGVENFPRLLESWSSKTLTYNGSMVVMFPSRTATNFWVAPGTYYNAPKRKWAFDLNFLNMDRLPPGTPQIRKLQRGQWSIVSAAETLGTVANAQSNNKDKTKNQNQGQGQTQGNLGQGNPK